jgi:hypothetical protein
MGRHLIDWVETAALCVVAALALAGVFLSTPL